ncbi:hypothetical protein LJC53_07345, partial [Bacteroidales bacterium OttesenSCG-928-C03]|nr:hypothetical protein [Bacteroidales bacterium OttesenSCG-928-C03]
MRTKTTLLLCALCFCLINANSQTQESYLKNRWNLKFGYAPYATAGYTAKRNGDIKVLKTADFRLEGNYGLLNFLEIGAYVGYARYKDCIVILTEPADSNGLIHNAALKDGHFLSYGLQANFHIFPLFIKKPDFRFDLYVTAKYGGRSSLVSKDYKYSHEWGVGLGLAFYFTQQIGIFGEYSLG